MIRENYRLKQIRAGIVLFHNRISMRGVAFSPPAFKFGESIDKAGSA